MALLIGGSLARWLVRVGVRDRTHLGNEKRQHSQGCYAKFDPMRPLEQGQPLMQEPGDASTVRVSAKEGREKAAEIRHGSAMHAKELDNY